MRMRARIALFSDSVRRHLAMSPIEALTISARLACADCGVRSLTSTSEAGGGAGDGDALPHRPRAHDADRPHDHGASTNSCPAVPMLAELA